MITNEHVEKFVEQARRYGKERWMLCSSGDLSWRVGNEMLVSGTGSWLRDLKKDKVAICRMMDRQCINGVKPSMEFDFHAGVYRNRQDVNVVLHFQSEFATAVACMKNKPTNFNVVAEIPCKLGRTIPILPSMRPGSSALAKAVVDAMVNHDAVLLASHGQVVCGRDFDDVFEAVENGETPYGIVPMFLKRLHFLSLPAVSLCFPAVITMCLLKRRLMS